jgi:hypothetical protein
MRHIDAFCHFFPQGIFNKLSETTGGTRDIGKRIQGVRTIHDLDARFRIMDGFENYSQVLSLGMPPITHCSPPMRRSGRKKAGPISANASRRWIRLMCPTP